MNCISIQNGKKFKNFIAVQLMRTISAWNEWGIGDSNLYYLRTKDGKEADFLITNYDEPLIIIESKFSDKNLDKKWIITFFLKKL